MSIVTGSVFAENKRDDATFYRTANIEGLDIYYREAGSRDNPTVILLHDFPTSSHMFRTLIPKLSDDYHVIAPNYPGYGNSPMPLVSEFEYTFDHMAAIVEQLISKLELKKYSLYVMDYGAPIGFRIAANHPMRVQSLIIQNGNAYDEGIDNNFWEPIKAYWQNRRAVNVGLDNPWWINVKNAYKQPNMANEDALLSCSPKVPPHGNTPMVFVTQLALAMTPSTWINCYSTAPVIRTFSCRCFMTTVATHHSTQSGKPTSVNISQQH